MLDAGPSAWGGSRAVSPRPPGRGPPRRRTLLMPPRWFPRLCPARAAHPTPRARRSARRPLVEPLETRQLLASFTVTNTNDAGAGSLRQAILASDAAAATAAAPNRIIFAIGTGTRTIAPLSALPALTQPTALDGTTQPGTGAAPRIVLVGDRAGATASGLVLKASNTAVKGLAIGGFAVDGLLVDGVSSATITGNYVGVTAAGTAAKANGTGIEIRNGAKGNVLTGNLISGNAGNGVTIAGAGTSGNTLSGNRIGTDAAGLHALPNRFGVYVTGGSSGNTIGGTTAAARNL